MEMKEIIKLCEECFGEGPEKVDKLAGAGSSRRYYRLHFSRAGEDVEAPPTVIATVGDDVKENRAFCELARIFGYVSEAWGTFRGPKVYGVSESCHAYLQEDCGDESLLSYIYKVREEAAGEEAVKMVVRRVLDGLLDMQKANTQILDQYLYARPFSKRRVRSDLYYFKNCFLRPSGVGFNEDELDNEIDEFARYVMLYSPRLSGFMYRDFQSRNVLMGEGAPCFIDFQGGMIGPVVYDLVSFLWQAKAGFSDGFRREMVDYYSAGLAARCDAKPEEVEAVLGRFVLLRTLQVLGAYGFRGLVEHKAHFIESIPQALENLQTLLQAGELDKFPELRRCCSRLVELDKFKPEPHEGLRVEVVSFSFKKGYPENFTGNGGGFVFDCRGMHNPGRYEEYKPLTGNDRPVIDFLEERGEVQEFVKTAGALVMPTVDTYLRRGFKDLQIAFGCTGGRHRSVYCANAMARLLRERYPDLDILLIHREQGERRFY